MTMVHDLNLFEIVSNILNRLACVVVSLVFSVIVAAPAWAESTGVVLQYHRISDSGPVVTRTSPVDFAAHLELIERLGYPVQSLDWLLAGLCDQSD